VKNYALIVVDLIIDNVNPRGNNLLDKEVVRILPTVIDMARHFRRNGGRVVFACDSFIEGDFIFKSRIPPHAIRGTLGDRPLDELEMQAGDLYLPKRRMSAFYKTDLDQTLRTWGVDTVAVCGIVTNVCVLLTALDAVQNDFHAILVSDACACHSREIHEATVNTYEKLMLAPIFHVMPSAHLIQELVQNP
jgi:nicotinamidase-related amidase